MDRLVIPCFISLRITPLLSAGAAPFHIPTNRALRVRFLTSSPTLALPWFGLVWFGLVWSGLVWFGLVCLGLVWFGLSWFALLCLGLLCFALVCFALVCFALVCFALVWFGLSWFGLVCLGLLCLGLVWFGYSSRPNRLAGWLYVSRAISDVLCLFMDSLVSVGRCRFHSLPRLKSSRLVLRLRSCGCSLHIRAYNSRIGPLMGTSSLPSRGRPFSLSIAFCDAQTLSIYPVNFFLLVPPLLVSCPRNHCQIQGREDPPRVSSRHPVFGGS